MDATLVDNDIDDDGRSQYWCDGIQWDDARFARQDADQVAEQGHGTPRKQGDGKQRVMIRGTQKQTGNVRYGQSDERYRATESRSYRGKDTGSNQEEVACTLDVHAQVLGIPIA